MIPLPADSTRIRFGRLSLAYMGTDFPKIGLVALNRTTHEIYCRIWRLVIAWETPGPRWPGLRLGRRIWL